ncbi:MAG: hypothetical protein KF865_12930 [Bdellovibrionaceae bacterium]|nr:hypothetical protein [Pseudobdellovibrionaceae bacterium]
MLSIVLSLAISSAAPVAATKSSKVSPKDALPVKDQSVNAFVFPAGFVFNPLDGGGAQRRLGEGSRGCQILLNPADGKITLKKALTWDLRSYKKQEVTDRRCRDQAAESLRRRTQDRLDKLESAGRSKESEKISSLESKELEKIRRSLNPCRDFLSSQERARIVPQQVLVLTSPEAPGQRMIIECPKGPFPRVTFEKAGIKIQSVAKAPPAPPAHPRKNPSAPARVGRQ